MFNHTSKTRFIALFLASLMLFSTSLINNPLVGLAAGSEPSLKIGSGQIAPGETVVIAITAQNIPSPGLAGYEISVQYDPVKLEIIGLEKSASDPFSMQIPNLHSPGIVMLTAMQASGVEGDLTLARLRIKAKDVATGSTELKLIIKKLVFEDLNYFQAQVINGVIDISTTHRQIPLPPSPLTIGLVSLPIAVINQPYSFRLYAHNGNPPYVWSASGLPDGLIINPQTGEISGIPTTNADSSFVQVSISDDKSPVQTVSAQMILEVTGSQGGIVLPQPSKVFESTRVSGKTAAQTAVQIADKTGWTSIAILASSASYGMVDALTAGPLATFLKAPILLTEAGNVLNADTKAELKKLNVKKVFVTSGTSVISQAILNELRGMNITVESLGGVDRFATSANIAQKLIDLGAPVTKVAVAYGWQNQDALSIAAIASAQTQPILLTEKDVIPDSIKMFLTKNAGIKKTDVIGGTSVISTAVFAQLPSATRHFGNTAYDTNLQVIKDFDPLLKYDHVYLANGETAIDALAGAPLAAQSKSAIILTNKAVPEAATFVNSKLTAGSVVTALGGIVVVPDTVLVGAASRYTP